MSPLAMLKTMWRQARGARGRLAFFVACIAVGVAAVVGVAALVDTVELGVRSRSREMLGGDLAVESRQALPDVDALLPAELAQAPRIQLTLLPTMARTDTGDSRLVEVKAVATQGAAFPLAGTLDLQPRRPLHELLTDQSVIIARAVAEALRVGVGDALHIGGTRFIVNAILEREPEPIGFSFVFGPRVLMTQTALEATDLIGLGHRVKHKRLYRLPSTFSGARLASLQQSLEARLPGGGTHVRVETHEDAQPALRRTLERVRSYLGLVALLSLLIASVGVAQITGAWVAQAAPQTAILRCLGMRPREVLRLYLGQVLLLSIVGSAVGCTLGAALPGLVLSAYPDLAPGTSAVAVPVAAIARGMLLGVGVALAFAIPPLTAIWQISPARVLRAEVAPLPTPRLVRALAFGTLASGVLLSALAQTRDVATAASFALGVSAVTASLWLAARGVMRAVARLPRQRLPVLAWHGAAALTRPAAGTTGSIVALGLGTLVVLGITLIESVLVREVATALPKEAPSVFLLDVQPDQWPEVERIVQDAGGEHVQSVPVIMARLKSVDGRTVESLIAEREGRPGSGAPDRMREEERPRQMLTREQRITMLDALPPSNTVVEGTLWSRPDVRNELSVEQDYARDLGAKLGSTLAFDVQGVPIEFVITSLRKVEWRSFSVNFFLVAEPDGPLAKAPRFMLGAARVPVEREQGMQNQLAERFPNVTVLRVRSMIERASELLAQVAVAVRLLGAFAALTGLVILAGAVASTQLRRAREAALLKALGVTRRRVVTLFAVEYAVTGAVAATIAALGAYGLALLFTRYTLELTTAPSWTTCLLGFCVTVSLSIVAGLLASARALREPPLALLRD